MRVSHSILAILILGLPLAAQSARFGVQAAVSVPNGDLNDYANLGLQFGGHGQWNFGNGHGLIGRIDAAFYGQKNDVTVSSLSGGADYTYHFERRPVGLYVLAGLTEARYTQDYSGSSYNSNSLGIDLGVGYDVDRNLGFQVRVTNHTFDNDWNNNSLTMSSVNFGVLYTF